MSVVPLISIKLSFEVRARNTEVCLSSEDEGVRCHIKFVCVQLVELQLLQHVLWLVMGGI